ncbi:MAG TPA: NPCBM/NEW2 domain-containing protein [Tepidisphaeraceae bacterium]|nr:NPCBM/NEW2 domain-containing protein [Tepidisphaeraceae bacterium]
MPPCLRGESLRWICATAFLAVAFLTSLARAQSSWTLTTADFHTDPVLLNGIDDSGIHVSALSDRTKRVVALDHFLELTRQGVPEAITGKFVLHMAGGDRLGGQPVSIKGNDLVWESPVLGQLRLPMKRLIGITQPGKTPPDARPRMDIVSLANGDTLKGIVTNIGDGKVAVQADAGNSEIALSSVASIDFAATGSAAMPQKAFRVRFEDGSSIVATTLAMSDDRLKLDLSKDENRQVDLKHIIAIEQVNGPVSWLSSRAPVENIYIPYFGNRLLYPARMDANYRGSDIRFGEQRFVRGIGVHAYSRLAWNLDGSYAGFRTRYAIDGDSPMADVTVRIKLDDKVAYEKRHVHAGVLSPVVLLELKDARQLTLEVDFGEAGGAQDRLNWIEPALMKSLPPPPPPPAPTPTSLPTTKPSTEPATQPAAPATQPPSPTTKPATSE